LSLLGVQEGVDYHPVQKEAEEDNTLRRANNGVQGKKCKGMRGPEK
jgi:hypothetical protein